MKTLKVQALKNTEFISFANNLKNKDSDLEVAIMACAVLDQALELVLLDSFIPLSKTKRDELNLFDIGGILSAVNTKAKIAYATGLITECMYLNLCSLFKVRNLWAHIATVFEFTHPDVEKLTYKLCIYSHMVEEAKFLKEKYKVDLEDMPMFCDSPLPEDRLMILDSNGYAGFIADTTKLIYEENNRNRYIVTAQICFFFLFCRIRVCSHFT